MQPLVSIVIPCFNSEKYLPQAIESALKQDYDQLEIILVDDGSDDNSLRVASTFQDKRLKIIKQKNQGACSARNSGLKVTTGKYIKFLDADDILAHGVIRKQVAQAESVDESTIIFGYAKNFVGDTSNPERYPKSIHKVDQEFLTELVLKNILTSCPLYRRRLLVSMGGFDTGLKYRQEWALNLRLYLTGSKFKYFNTMTYYRRLHGSGDRISNRRHQGAEELENLENILKSLPERRDPDYLAAWAYVYWRAGRYVLVSEGKLKASLLFNRSRDLAPGKFKKYWPVSYKFAVSVFGLYLPELALLSMRKFVRTLQYRLHE